MACLNASHHPQHSSIVHERMLIQNLTENREHAFRILYDDYKSALLSIIYKMVKNEEEAEDVLQESFINISRHIQQYDPAKGRLFTWMASLARNKALDHMRRSASRKASFTIDVLDLDEDVLLRLQIYDFNVDTIGMKSLLGCLTSSQLQIIDLIYFNSYTHAEVAEELKMPLGTIKTRNRMAMATLRNLF